MYWPAIGNLVCVLAYHWLFVLYDVIFYRHYKKLNFPGPIKDSIMDGMTDKVNYRVALLLKIQKSWVVFIVG